MHTTLNNNYFLKKEEKHILELAMQVYDQTKTPRELITEAFNLLKEKALQTAKEKEIKQKEAEAEMEKIHAQLRKNKEFMNLEAQDLDEFIYG